MCLYFSPTHTTKKVVTAIGKGMGTVLELPVIEQSFTLPKSRVESPAYSNQTIVICGLPVYAGRLPNLMLPYLKQVVGNGALAVPIVLYGNRNYDDALMELSLLLQENKFKLLGGGAFVGEHSFSEKLALGRPSSQDLQMANQFGVDLGNKVANIWRNDNRIGKVTLPGNCPIGSYYTPRDHMGNSIDIRKVKPKTADYCTLCGYCAKICPMGAISFTNPKEITGVCIKCGACIKECPVGAKYYDDANYLYHKKELEDTYTKTASNEVYL